MKNPDIRLYINDMKESAKKILDKTQGLSLQEFRDNEFLQLAIERLFEILGEAANRIPKMQQENYPQIPWARIIGLRNIIIHAYDKVNTERLFEVIQENLPQLKEELDKIWQELS